MAQHDIRIAEGSRELQFQQVCNCSPWRPRYGHAAVVFQDRIWILGGTGTCAAGTQSNDIWSSPDGLNWRLELANAPWSPRWCHAVFVLDDRLWLIGGLSRGDRLINLTDIWCSDDGIHWDLAVAEAPWEGRHVWGACRHANGMYLIAGATNGVCYHNDVLFSADGVHWNQHIVKDSWFSKRKRLATVSFNKKLFVIGGAIISQRSLGGALSLNDVWVSETHGCSWQCLTTSPPWSARCAHHLVAWQNRLWADRREDNTHHYATDIWSSEDGRIWIEHGHYPWTPRHDNAMVVFNEKLWMLGGTTDGQGTCSTNDVWVIQPRIPMGQ